MFYAHYKIYINTHLNINKETKEFELNENAS